MTKKNKLIIHHLDFKEAMLKKEYIFKIINRLAKWGFNNLMFEMDNKFKFSQNYEFIHQDAFCIEEIQEITCHMRVKGMECIPFLQTLFHTNYIFKFKRYQHLCETIERPNQYDPFLPEAKMFIKNMLDELIEAFQPKEFVHLGGDEAHHLAKSKKYNQLRKKKGVGWVYIQHILPLIEHVLNKGLRPMLWADMLLAYPEVIEKIPKEVLLVSWDYFTTSNRPKSIIVWGTDKKTGLHNQERTVAELDDIDVPNFQENLRNYTLHDHSLKERTFKGFYCSDVLKDKGYATITASGNRSVKDSVAAPALFHHDNIYYSTLKGIQDGEGTMVTSWAVRHVHPELTFSGSYSLLAAASGNKGEWRERIDNYTLDEFGIKLKEYSELLKCMASVAPMSEAWSLDVMSRVYLKKDIDPFDSYLNDLNSGIVIHKMLYRESIIKKNRIKPNSRDEWRNELIYVISQCKDIYLKAKEILTTIKVRVIKNADQFNFWEESINYMILFCDFNILLYSRKLQPNIYKLEKRIFGHKNLIRKVYSKTYSPNSVQDEIEFRMGVFTTYLSKFIAGKFTTLK